MKVTVSKKYQVVIPKEVRRQLGIRPGQKLDVKADGKGGVHLAKGPAELDMMTWIERHAGSIDSHKTAWGKAGVDAAAWLRAQRDEAWD